MYFQILTLNSLAIKDKKDESIKTEKKIEGTDFEFYVETAKNIFKLRKLLTEELITSGSSKVFQTNRLCLVNPSEPAIIIGRSGQTVTVLFNERKSPFVGLEKEILYDYIFSSIDENKPVIKTVEITGKEFQFFN